MLDKGAVNGWSELPEQDMCVRVLLDVVMVGHSHSSVVVWRDQLNESCEKGQGKAACKPKPLCFSMSLCINNATALATVGTTSNIMKGMEGEHGMMDL